MKRRTVTLLRPTGGTALLVALLVTAAGGQEEPMATPTPAVVPPEDASPPAAPPEDASPAAPSSPSPTSSPTPSPTSPTPSPTPTPPASLVSEPGEPPDLVLEEVIGPPAPDDPVARVKAKVTVKPEKGKKKKQRKEKLAGEAEVADKQWLSEVCPLEETQGGTWLDRSQQRLGWSVCRATLWFDGLFGDERAIEERDATYGYVEPKLWYSDHDGLDPDARARAKINLPVADRRFNALLGRSDDDEDDPRQQSQRDEAGSEQLPQSFRDADEEWLVGLGYSPVRGSRKRLDFDAGVNLGTEPDVFAQGRYRRHWFISERDLVRLRETVFWRTDDGFGTRLNLDFERVLRGRYVARWRQGATWAQRLEGVEWFEEATLFHRLGLKTALAYVLSADGATDAAVPVRNYGFELVYRRNILREWLYLELRPGLDYRRREIEDDRELEPVMSVGLQINFGDREFE